MRILLKALRWTAAIAVILVVIGVAWNGYGRTQTSEAAELGTAMGMVHHQTEAVSTNLSQTVTVVEEARAPRAVSEITRVDDLIAVWEPRYTASHAAYVRFDAAITAAESRAQGYFDAKSALAARYHDEGRRARAEAEDAAEYNLFLAWQERAHATREDAAHVLRRFDDLDTDLRRLRLTAEFTFDVSAFDAVPLEITQLNADLAEFQVASDNIRAFTQSPFERN